MQQYLTKREAAPLDDNDYPKKRVKKDTGNNDGNSDDESESDEEVDPDEALFKQKSVMKQEEPK